MKNSTYLFIISLIALSCDFIYKSDALDIQSTILVSTYFILRQLENK